MPDNLLSPQKLKNKGAISGVTIFKTDSVPNNNGNTTDSVCSFSLSGGKGDSWFSSSPGKSSPGSTKVIVDGRLVEKDEFEGYKNHI